MHKILFLLFFLVYAEDDRRRQPGGSDALATLLLAFNSASSFRLVSRRPVQRHVSMDASQISELSSTIPSEGVLSQGMPAVLAAWGCDEVSWNQIQSKNMRKQLRRFAREGNETEARVQISKLMAALQGARSRNSNNIMPAELSAWGCDAALWKKLRSARLILSRYAREGKEEEARKKIADIRQKLSPEMPAVLAAWGCDEAFWNQRSDKMKRKLSLFARTGNETGAREQISNLRSIIQRYKTNEAEGESPTANENDASNASDTMPAELSAWGCDVMLWSQITLEEKLQFCQLAVEGKKDIAQKLISAIRWKLDLRELSTMPMPIKLGEWGCDEALWKRLTGKRVLLSELASAGKEAEARDVILQSRSEMGEDKGASAASRMPAKLAAWGCDEAFWSQINSVDIKNRLVHFAQEGNEDLARDQLSSLRRIMANNETLMPTELAAWGCDDTLWNKIRSEKIKKKLTNFARVGNEAAARDEISNLRDVIDSDIKIMPAELAAWGCDQVLWKKLRSRRFVLSRLAREGKAEEAQELIADIRKTLEKRKFNMPTKLAAWGFDDALWKQIKSVDMKVKLLRFAREGNETAAQDLLKDLRLKLAFENFETVPFPKEEDETIPPSTEEDRNEIIEHHASLGKVGAISMPSQLTAWGCSEELWNKIQSAQRRARLCQLAAEGREEDARRLILLTRQYVELHEKPMPAELAFWGCDEALWSQLYYKRGVLSQFAAQGREEEARKLIAAIRKSFFVPRVMLPKLAEWGCNELLWSEIKSNRIKRQLYELAIAGKEDEARRLISFAAIKLELKKLPMPVELAEWGCDQALWKKLRSTRVSLRQLAAAGKEKEARELISHIRADLAEDIAGGDMPAILASWGFDQALWSQITSTRIRSLLRQFAREGKKEEASEQLSLVRQSLESREDTKPKEYQDDAGHAIEIVPSEVAKLGCDSVLWNQMRPRQRLRLRQVALEGKDEDATEMISFTRQSLELRNKPMPLELAALGCDEVLWRRLKGTRVKLCELVAAGKETEAQNLIFQIRAHLQEDAGDGGMPAMLAAWGFDEALWNQIGSKRIRSLLRQLAREGDKLGVSEIEQKFAR